MPKKKSTMPKKKIVFELVPELHAGNMAADLKRRGHMMPDKIKKELDDMLTKQLMLNTGLHEYFHSQPAPSCLFHEGTKKDMERLLKYLGGVDAVGAHAAHPAEGHAHNTGLEIVPVEDSPESKKLRRKVKRLFRERDKFKNPKYLRKMIDTIEISPEDTEIELLEKLGVGDIDRKIEEISKKRTALMFNGIRERIHEDSKDLESLYYRMVVGEGHFEGIKGMLEKEFGERISFVDPWDKIMRKWDSKPSI